MKYNITSSLLNTTSRVQIRPIFYSLRPQNTVVLAPDASPQKIVVLGLASLVSCHPLVI
jgi:hypothetical protein